MAEYRPQVGEHQPTGPNPSTAWGAWPPPWFFRVQGVTVPRCKECGAAIEYVKTPNGKSMPIDRDHIAGIPLADLVEPNDRVVVMIRGSEVGYTVTVKDRADVVRFYTPHWGNCTNPDRFRGGDHET